MNYSSLHEGFVDVIVGPGGEAGHFIINDANELHAGVEYVFSNWKMTPSLQFGSWYDPAHEVRFERSSTLNPFFNDLFASALNGGRNLVHFTGGAGLSVSRRLELNVAVDLTHANNLLSASTVVRF